MMMSDEVTTPISKETDGIRIMKGQQSASNPKFGLWSGWSDQGPLWEGIRHCNVLIENIYNVVDMTEDEMNIWAAEAKFLKAITISYCLHTMVQFQLLMKTYQFQQATTK